MSTITTDENNRPPNDWQVVVFNVDAKNLIHEEASGWCEVALHLYKPHTGKKTEVQAKERQVRVHLDTNATPPFSGKLNPVMLQRSFVPAARPWKEAGTLRFQADVTINEFQTRERAVAYVQAVFLLRDEESRQQFWFSVQIWDPRGFDYPKLIGWSQQMRDIVTIDLCERCTGLPNFLTTIENGNPYLKTQPQSANSFSDITGARRTISFEIGPPEIRRALEKLRTQSPSIADLSPKPEDLSLKLAAIEVEGWSDVGASVILDVTLSNWQLQLY
ncbi:hypothetical protein HZZ13_19345 [Bradyrhizobium sp. CNPSo 4010]|uniref:Uncharacterized protein n=1 Tax=Bradyrhizobium agreste TaxID=2751811 RepID=A0ABS0PSH6_9BRAD|nr:hypothetical protein [Bradyrhizobium agreste]MBH5399926.1 hypothetical protein [Bradyrhizobium agreste]